MTATLLGPLCTELALTRLPARLEVDGDTVVIHLPPDVSSRTEVAVLQLVGAKAAAFRCAFDLKADCD